MTTDHEFGSENSIEQIRSRMIRNAMRIWGTSDTADPESSFDPLVMMLVEACAFELKKIHSEIRTSQTRVLNRLAQILSPEALVGPQPAHAILHARSVEPFDRLDSLSQFFINKKVSGLGPTDKDINKEIFLSPNRPVRICDGDIRFVATGGELFEYKSPVSRVQLTEGSRSGNTDRSVLWIGLELSPAIQQLDDLSFYFDWKTDPMEDHFLHLSSLVRWKLGDRELTVRSGAAYDDQTYDDKSFSALSRQHEIMTRVEKLVTEYYDTHFFTLLDTIHEEEIRSLKCTYPQEFEGLFTPQTLSRIQGSYLWFRLRFPSAIPPEAVRDLYVSINCFPAVNRRLNKLIYRLNNNLNIVPLPTEDLFFDLHSVENTDGKPFISNPLSSGFRNESGYFTLRYGGLERFDSRHATELLDNLINLLRDENAAFSSLGNDFIHSSILQISQAIALIENRLESKGARNKPDHFLLINPFLADESIYVNYWTTTGAIGNGLKSGSKLTNYSGNDLRAESLVFVTTSGGGKDSLNENERIMAYKKSLLAHDRIVSEQDIRTACFHELGNLLSKVEIKKGWDVPKNAGTGIRRIQDVVLYPSSRQQLSEEEWNGLVRELELKIKQQSANIIPVSIRLADRSNT